MELREIVEEIKTKTVVEINELVKMLEEEFGVSAAAAVVAGPVAGAGAAAGIGPGLLPAALRGSAKGKPGADPYGQRRRDRH